MEQSPTIAKLAAALCGFQADMENVSKDATNPFFRSRYASLENIISAAKPHLTKHKLSFAQFPSFEGLTTILMHESGEFISSDMRIVIKDQTPQGQGSALTYARRYALSAVLGIATEDDDDGNAASKAPVASQDAPGAKKTAPPKRANPPVYRSPSVRELDAKTRIVELVDKLNDGEAPGFETKEEKAKYYGDEVFRLTGSSLSLATPEEMEAIGDELGKLFDAKT